MEKTDKSIVQHWVGNFFLHDRITEKRLLSLNLGPRESQEGTISRLVVGIREKEYLAQLWKLVTDYFSESELAITIFCYSLNVYEEENFDPKSSLASVVYESYKIVYHELYNAETELNILECALCDRKNSEDISLHYMSIPLTGNDTMQWYCEPCLQMCYTRLVDLQKAPEYDERQLKSFSKLVYSPPGKAGAVRANLLCRYKFYKHGRKYVRYARDGAKDIDQDDHNKYIKYVLERNRTLEKPGYTGRYARDPEYFIYPFKTLIRKMYVDDKTGRVVTQEDDLKLRILFAEVPDDPTGEKYNDLASRVRVINRQAKHLYFKGDSLDTSTIIDFSAYDTPGRMAELLHHCG